MPALVNSSVGSSCGTTLSGRHERVAMLLDEEVDELLAYLVSAWHDERIPHLKKR